MKKFIKLAFSLMLTLSLVMALSVSAFAAGTVTYNDNAEEFVFAPGSAYSPTDLFSNYKGVMPGDVLTDSVEIKHNIDADEVVEIWFKANGATDMPEGVNDLEFLSQLGLKVIKADGTVIVDQPLDTTNWVLLGSFKQYESTVLNLELSVPLEFEVVRPEGMSDDEYNAYYDKVQNSFGGTAGYIDWEFKAEVFETKSVDTSDTSNMMLYFGIMAVSALVLFLLIFLKRRKAEEE